MILLIPGTTYCYFLSGRRPELLQKCYLPIIFVNSFSQMGYRSDDGCNGQYVYRPIIYQSWRNGRKYGDCRS